MKFSKAKVMVAGLVLAVACMIAPQQLKAEVPAAQMDGVMGQSIEDETVYEETPNLDALIMQGATATYSLPTMRAATGSSYSQDFLDSSFTTAGTYTSTTYYHKADYEDYQLINGIDVSWWQTKDKKNTALNWEKAHDAGIDFAFVRVGSRDTSDGSIYEDTAADSHIQAALENDINIGLYIFSQALTEKEAREEAFLPALKLFAANNRKRFPPESPHFPVISFNSAKTENMQNSKKIKGFRACLEAVEVCRLHPDNNVIFIRVNVLHGQISKQVKQAAVHVKSDPCPFFTFWADNDFSAFIAVVEAAVAKHRKQLFQFKLFLC